ncbi:hypothetical protein BDW68DRAFT_184409 [Aspergillus falconensis]
MSDGRIKSTADIEMLIAPPSRHAEATSILDPCFDLRAPIKTLLKTNAGHNKENVIGYGETYKHADELKGTVKQSPTSFPHYLPVRDETESSPSEHYDHGKDADPAFPDLFRKDRSFHTDDLTPIIGSEVSGIQSSQLSKEGKDQLALFVAQRKVVVFCNQDFAHLPIDKALEFGGYFGRHHIHQASGASKGYPEIHLVYRGADDTRGADFLAEHHTNLITWHSDVIFEVQPPELHTLFADMAQAYKRLSPELRRRLHSLRAVHSGVEQVNNSLNKGICPRKLTITHPLVARHIFLYSHIALLQDIQTRVRWRPGTVVVWYNRVACHGALFDWADGQRRHLAGITPQAERPYETPFEA